jgi:stress response protein SCP2
MPQQAACHRHAFVRLRGDARQGEGNAPSQNFSCAATMLPAASK